MFTYDKSWFIEYRLAEQEKLKSLADLNIISFGNNQKLNLSPREGWKMEVQLSIR